MRWSNVPVPESHLGAIALGAALHRARPARLLPSSRIGRLAGWLVLAAGASLAAWAVSAAGDEEMSEPATLVRSGPYAFTRNPMYLAWTILGAGTAATLNSAWVLALLAAAVAHLHFREIPNEERLLERRFGADYAKYRARVPRWL